jgi:hypothetical protein
VRDPMATTAQGYMEAFGIFAKYSKDTCFISAEHDVIYAGIVWNTISEADKKRLEELGWGESEDFDGITRKFV